MTRARTRAYCSRKCSRDAANDLWHWHVNITTGDAKAAALAVRKHGFDWVSPGAIDVGTAHLGYGSAVMVRDPDRHGILLRQP